MAAQGLAQYLRYLKKADALFEVGGHRYFVGGIENRRRGATGLDGLVGQPHARETLQVRGMELQRHGSI